MKLRKDFLLSVVISTVSAKTLVIGGDPVRIDVHPSTVKLMKQGVDFLYFSPKVFFNPFLKKSHDYKGQISKDFTTKPDKLQCGAVLISK